MTTFPDLYLSFEDGMIPEVHCSRCDKFLGRVDMVSLPAESSAAERRREIEGELRGLLNRHRGACRRESSATR